MTAAIAPSTENWTLDLPGEVQASLLVAESLGAAVDLTGTDPVFYEVYVPLVGGNPNMGALTGTAVREVRSYLKRYDVPNADLTIIGDAMRRSAYSSGPFHAGLGNLMRWFQVEDINDPDEYDEDYMLDETSRF